MFDIRRLGFHRYTCFSLFPPTLSHSDILFLFNISLFSLHISISDVTMMICWRNYDDFEVMIILIWIVVLLWHWVMHGDYEDGVDNDHVLMIYKSERLPSILNMLCSFQKSFIGRDGQLRTSLYDRRDDFNFHITNFPFLSSNIPSSLYYGVFISLLSDTPGRAPLMNVVFWGRSDFPISYLGMDMSRNV